MYINTSTEYQNHPVIVKMIEDEVGGGVICHADFKTATDELPAGALVGKGADGLYHLIKTAKAIEASSSSAIKVDKTHDLKVGDFMTNTGLTLSAYAITAIDTTNTEYDTITVGTALGSVTENMILAQATEEADNSGSSAVAPTLKYAPKGITINSVDLTEANTASGIMVRGTVDESLMPYFVDATLKALLPLIRFV